MAGLEIALFTVCMILGAFFAGIETGVISIHRVRLRHLVEHKLRRARILQNFLDHPDRLLTTVLVGENLCVVVCSISAASLATKIVPVWGAAASSIVVTILVLIFSEYLPKAWFQSRPLERSLPFADVLQASSYVLRPVGVVIHWLTDWLVPKAHNPRILKPFVTREDLKTLTRELSQHGAISADERAMIDRVLALSSRTAGKVMKQRESIVKVDSAATVGELLEAARQSGFRRYPVYAAADKRFIGIVNVEDVLAADRMDLTCGVTDFMRSPQFVPDYMPADEIIPRMRRAQQPMLLVTDAHSQVVGLVTTEDVLSEIVNRG